MAGRKRSAKATQRSQANDRPRERARKAEEALAYAIVRENRLAAVKAALAAFIVTAIGPKKGGELLERAWADAVKLFPGATCLEEEEIPF